MLDEPERVKDDAEPLEQTDGGFGGTIDGGFKLEKSSSTMGGENCGTGPLSSPMKSGGGRTNAPGGGGGALVGGGGTNISPSSRSWTDMTDPLEKLSPPTEPLILWPLTGGSRGTLGVGTATPCRLSILGDMWCLTVGLALTLAVPESRIAVDPSTSSALSISVILTLVSKRDRFFRPRRWSAPFFMTTDQQNDTSALTD